MLAACGAAPRVSHAPGVEPVSQPRAVIDAALARIAQMENANGKRLATPRITSLTAMSGSDAHDATGWGPDGLDFATVWLVEAEGTFTPIVVGEPSGWVRPSSSLGWIIVRDADGVVLASGMAAAG